MRKLVMSVLQSFVLLLTLLIAAVGFAAPLQPSFLNNTDDPNAGLSVLLQAKVNATGDDTCEACNVWWRDWEQANAMRPERYIGDSFTWWRDWEHAPK